MARKRGFGGFLQGVESDIGKGVNYLFGGSPKVPGGGSSAMVLPQTSSGVPQVPGYSDASSTASTPDTTNYNLQSNPVVQNMQNGYNGAFNTTPAGPTTYNLQQTPQGNFTSTVNAAPAPTPPATSADITGALQSLSADWFSAMARGDTAAADRIHQQALQLRQSHPGGGPANGYTQAQLQGAGYSAQQLGQAPPPSAPSAMVPFQPPTTAPAAAPSSMQSAPRPQSGPATAPAAQTNYNLAGNPVVTALQNGYNGAGQTQPAAPGTTILDLPSGLRQTPTPGAPIPGVPYAQPTVPQATTPPASPQVPAPTPKTPSVPGLPPSTPSGTPSIPTGLPTLPRTPTTVAGASPTGTPTATPGGSSFQPPKMQLGGQPQGGTSSTSYQQPATTPQQAQSNIQTGRVDLGRVADQLKAATPDVQALGAAFLTQYLQALDQAESQWRSQLAAEQKGLDPATQAAIDQIKQDVQLQRQQLMDEMNRRGLLQSGIVLEMTDRLNKNQLTSEEQVLGRSLSNVLSQLNNGLLDFAKMRTGAVLDFGKQAMQDVFSQGQQNQRNLLQLAGMQQSADQFQQDFGLRQGEALGSINGQPTLQAQEAMGQINGQPTMQAQQMRFNQGLNTAKFYTDATGTMYDPTTGKPIPLTDANGNPVTDANGNPQYLTTIKYQQMLNSQNNADRNFLLNLWSRSGQAPSGLEGYGVNAGQPSQQAIDAEARLNQTASNDQTRNLMQIWRDSGQAPDGLQSLGVAPGTAYYSPSFSTSSATDSAIGTALQMVQDQGPDAALQWAQQNAGSFAQYGVDPAKVISAINSASTASTNATVAQAASGG